MEVKPTLAEAWEQFEAFGDSVIRRVELLAPTVEEPSRRVVVHLNGWDPDGLFGPWCDVRFDFVDVEEYRFWHGNWTMEVVFEAVWAQLGDLVWVTFDETGVDPEAPTAEQFRSTVAFAAARTVEVTVRPFD